MLGPTLESTSSPSVAPVKPYNRRRPTDLPIPLDDRNEKPVHPTGLVENPRSPLGTDRTKENYASARTKSPTSKVDKTRFDPLGPSTTEMTHGPTLRAGHPSRAPGKSDSRRKPGIARTPDSSKPAHIVERRTTAGGD